MSQNLYAQPNRLVGGRSFVLDNNDLIPANNIFLVDNGGSLGIDNLGNITGTYPNTNALLTLLAGAKTTNLLIDGGSAWGIDIVNTNNSIRTSGSTMLGDGVGADNVTVNLGTGNLTLNGVPAPPAPFPLSNLLYLDGSNQVTQIPGGLNLVTGSGTLNTIPLWTPTGFNLANSIITQPSTAQIVITPTAGGASSLTVNNFNASATGLLLNAAGGTGLSISGATTAVTVDNGNLILGSTVNTIPSGATIPDGQAVVDVNDNGVPFLVATVTLPVTPTNGQVCYITTEDPDGVQITVGLASVTISNAEVGRFMFINGTWRLEH